MKPAPAPPAPSYRNERVFQSAQRLIASRPPPRRPRRWPKFAGLLILLLSSVLLLRENFLPWSDRESGARTPPESDGQSRHRGASDPKRATAIPDRSALTSAADQPALTTATAGPDSVAGRRATALSVETTPLAAARDLDTWLTTTTDGVTLRGMLYAEARVLIPVEFFLRRRDRQVSGVVRYLSFPGDRVLANAVSGEINGRILTLKETGRAWSFPKNPDLRVQPPEEVGREFTITLSERFGPKTLSGTWSLGRQKGTLQLTPAPPW